VALPDSVDDNQRAVLQARRPLVMATPSQLIPVRATKGQEDQT
jgi:hypothetical protein